MLQQTQVSRVIPKYEQFMYTFPTIQILMNANFTDVIALWKGLGYNRRALWLQQAAEQIVTEKNSIFPRTHAELVALKGIGDNTAGAILAYAYNEPAVFIETNIRRVFIHHCFHNVKTKVHDNDIRPLVAKSLEGQSPREWYWALMDYGSYLAQTIQNPNRQSVHHVRQSRFEGSHRQLRGLLLDLALAGGFTSDEASKALPGFTATVQNQALTELVDEGFLVRQGQQFRMKT